MKLFRDNKYAKKITKNLSAVLASSIILSGCASNVNVVDLPVPVSPTHTITTVEPTPEPTIEIIEPTPELPVETMEPIVTPEPTPFIRTIYEVPSDEYIQEEIEKLCVIDDTQKHPAYEFAYVLFEKDGMQRAVCVTMPNMEENTGNVIVKDAFTDTDLFSFSSADPGFSDDPSTTFVYAENLQNITPINPYFEDAKIIKIHIIWNYWYYDITKQYVPEENKYDFFYEITNSGPNDKNVWYDTAKARHTRQEIAYFYVKYLPEEYRINAYDLFPDLEHDRKALGAKTGRE